MLGDTYARVCGLFVQSVDTIKFSPLLTSRLIIFNKYYGGRFIENY